VVSLSLFQANFSVTFRLGLPFEAIQRVPGHPVLTPRYVVLYRNFENHSWDMAPAAKYRFTDASLFGGFFATPSVTQTTQGVPEVVPVLN
jgi:hypothetical protein